MKYFVEKLPESCSLCDCCHTKDYDWTKQYDGDKFCGIEDLDVTDRYAGFEYPERPDFCPLRELPGKREVFNNYDDYLNGIDDGWNACIDEILGE